MKWESKKKIISCLKLLYFWLAGKEPAVSIPAKFGVYELFRIVLPGFFCISLLCIVLFLFVPTRQEFTNLMQHSIFSFVVPATGLFIGLVLYAVDYPSTTGFYKKNIVPNMPSSYLKEILCDKCSASCKKRIKDSKDAFHTYFYLFNEHFSTSAQQRVYYFGSVYRIFADIRVMSGIFGFAILFISMLGFAWKNGLPPSDAIFGLLCGSGLVAFWIYLHPEFLSRKGALNKGDRYMRDIIEYQRRYLDLEIDQIKNKLCKKG